MRSRSRISGELKRLVDVLVVAKRMHAIANALDHALLEEAALGLVHARERLRRLAVAAPQRLGSRNFCPASSASSAPNQAAAP